MNSDLRERFEHILSELVGRTLSTETGDVAVATALNEAIAALISRNSGVGPRFDQFNSVLVYYGVPGVSRPFFDRYLGDDAFASLEAFESAVRRYQKDAIRLFSTFSDAFAELSVAGDLEARLAPLAVTDVDRYTLRPPWNEIERIEGEQAASLGYIPAARVRREDEDRTWLAEKLETLARELEERGSGALMALDDHLGRRIDTLLRRFGSTLAHGVSSPLFTPDPDELRREATRLGPKTGEELEELSVLQARAQRNLTRYITADFLDVYVATSMRTTADFVSVDRFVQDLFTDPRIEPLRLRFFNPTQSWVQDRIAKGLVEAVMLKRASVTIYMAQKTDTFGKDSEASVALGQGKPVIVYVPKLRLAGGRVDSETLRQLPSDELSRRLATALSSGAHLDKALDHEALLFRLLEHQVSNLRDEQVLKGVEDLWADFDLYGEATRISDPRRRAEYRSWLDHVRTGTAEHLPEDLRDDLVRTLVAVAVRLENRAQVFREIHPLALQVILSTGVLNGISVVRSVEQCAEILSALLRNDLDLEILKDDQNYRLVEKITGSTIRVISRHRLLSHAFKKYFQI